MARENDAGKGQGKEHHATPMGGLRARRGTFVPFQETIFPFD